MFACAGVAVTRAIRSFAGVLQAAVATLTAMYGKEEMVTGSYFGIYGAVIFIAPLAKSSR